MKKAYLVRGIRSPFAKAGTDFKKVSAVELGRFALSELLAKTNLPLTELGKLIDEVILGNTGTPSDAANISRVVALRGGLPTSVSAYSVHRNCASAMESVAQAALKIEAEQADIIVAGGTESMSQMPLMYNPLAVGYFERLSRAKTLKDKITIMAQMPIQEFLKPRIALAEGLTDPFCGLNMGQTAEVLSKEFKITRTEQDAYALESHQKALAAQEAGKFKEEIAPYAIPPEYDHILTADSGPRKGQSMEQLAKLKPYFDKKYGSVTVGNSCPITDGSCMLLIASEEGMQKLGNPKPLAVIKSYAFAGLEPERMGLGPVFASYKALNKAGLKLADMGVVEINEAFAAQVIGCLRAFESDLFCQDRFGLPGKMGSIDLSRLNPNGGAIAMGHPVGVTGSRIILTAALEMKRRNASHALATLCIGGGQGGAVVLEAVN